MTLQNFKEYMEENGFEYVGKATYEKKYGYGESDVKVQYVVKRPRVIMNYVNSVGKVTKAAIGKLNSIHVAQSGELTGMQQLMK